MASSRPSFVTQADLEAAAKYYKLGSFRLEAAQKIGENIDDISQKAYDACIKKYPNLNLNDFEPKPILIIKNHLRLIEYCLVVGGTYPIDESGIIEDHEVFRSLDLPINLFIDALQFIRENVDLGMSEEALREFHSMLDYLIASLS